TIVDSSLNDSEGQTYIEESGYYRRIGNLVNFWIDITINSLGTLTTSDAAQIDGLPFTCNASIRCASTVAIGASLAITAGNAVSAYVFPNTTRIILNKWSTTGGTSLMTIAEISTGGRLLVAGSYFI